MQRGNILCVGLAPSHSFRQPLGVLEYIPLGKEDYCIQFQSYLGDSSGLTWTTSYTWELTSYWIIQVGFGWDNFPSLCVSLIFQQIISSLLLWPWEKSQGAWGSTLAPLKLLLCRICKLPCHMGQIKRALQDYMAKGVDTEKKD